MSGAQAASAGVFITLAANISVMAPGTNIGAAHPVMMTEGGTSNQKDSLDIMMDKATNDAAAFIRTIAEKRNRNIDWAEKAVRKSLSLTETEAVKEKVIDFIARDMESLLNQLDGQITETANGSKTIRTKNADVRITEMSFPQKILDIISDPNLAYILLMLGFYGLLFELYNPGSILPGIVGVISLVLAFYSLHSLPINYAGLALIIFAIILFIAEIKIVSHGLLTAGGILSLLIGSLMLINTTVTFEFVQISLSVIITVTILTALFFIFALGKGIAAQRRKPTTGSEGLIGEAGVALSKIIPGSVGQIMLHGEIWEAESVDEEINNDENVKVIERSDLLLKVKKI
ncbi:MAG: NfeD family protein [Melioribacteraceae bacterium]